MAIFDPFFDVFRKERYKDMQVNYDDLQAPGKEGRKARREAKRIYRQLGPGAHGAFGAAAQQRGLDILKGDSPYEQRPEETARAASELASAESGAAAAQAQDLLREARGGGGVTQGAMEEVIGRQADQREDAFLRAYAAESQQARDLQFQLELRDLELAHQAALAAMEADDKATADFVAMMAGAIEGGATAGLTGGGGG